MKNKGCLLMRPLMLKAKSSKNFLSPAPKVPNFGGFRAWWSGFEKVSIFTAKGTSIRGSTSFETFCVKIGLGVWSPGQFWKKKVKKVTNIVYFTYLPRSPRWFDRHQICSGGWFPGRNELCQISFQSVQGFWFCRGSNFGLSHRNEVSPLTQGLNYRSACDE